LLADLVALALELGAALRERTKLVLRKRELCRRVVGSHERARERAVQLMDLAPELLDLAIRTEQRVAHARELAISGLEHRAGLLELCAHRCLRPLALVEPFAAAVELALQLACALLGLLPPLVRFLCAPLEVGALARKAADFAFGPFDLTSSFRERVLEIRDPPVSAFELAFACFDVRTQREHLGFSVGEGALRGMTCRGGLAREFRLLCERLARAVELFVELLGALPRLRGGGTQLLEVAARFRDRVAIGVRALARRFDLGGQLDDPLLALA
jgi:hypothetical protein